jgi:hypothetical protein
MVACVLLMAGCCNTVYTVTVTNPAGFDRHPEMVELCMSDVASALSLAENDTFVVKDENDNEVPYQVTSDEKIIFQVQMKASSKADYHICKGQPAVYETLVFGKQFPERLDDFVWENDLVGFRAYGPALQAKGERGFGYDLFTKRGTRQPVLADFYELAVGERTKKRYKELLAEDPQKARDYKLDTMTFHVDHGYGMDVYAVGPTLGAGVTALMDEGMIFPWCYKEYEIIENGPLRFSFRLTFDPIKVGGDENVVETRLITLDAGSYLNHTSVSYLNLTCDRELATGIVLRDKDGKETADLSKGYIAYPAPSINFDNRNPDIDNGTHFVGHVYPEAMKQMKTVFHSEKEMKEERGGAPGHVLACTDYEPGEEFTYYWGFGWDHSDMKTYGQWTGYLEKFAAQIREPLIVTVK